jgi:pimeloyl-ACP methyl ester carboxylesterase
MKNNIIVLRTQATSDQEHYKMDQLGHKTLVTKPHSLTYSYYLSPNFKKSQNPEIPTLLLCHGYPDDANMWQHVVPDLLKSPYPFILVEILGFGGSSKPTDPPLYNYRPQANSIAQILDRENVGNNVIPIGHDWGSATCQRFYLYHKPRCIGLVLLSLAYQIPSAEKFDLVQANKETTKRFGYPQWEYWNFFTAPDAPELMKSRINRFYEVMHGVYPSDECDKPEGRDIWMRKMFDVPNGMREYITGTGKYKDFTVDLHEYAKDQTLRKTLESRWTRDGLEGPVCYYHTLKNNTNFEDEKQLIDKPDCTKIEVPHLYIGMTGDWVCRTDLTKDAIDADLMDDVEEKVIDAHHWCLYDPARGKEAAGIVLEWIDRKYSSP